MRENLHKISLLKGTAESIKTHKKVKNKLSKKLFSAKRKFINQKVYDSEGDKAKMWKAINQMSNGFNFNKKKKDSIEKLVDNEGNVITDQKEMANLLNYYFNSIGDDLEKKATKRRIQ